ncbi:MAG: hypothetical protein A3J83_01415 [Elusimicrobia bacterium RIFOXYA2_FULL_40_6]|nr:MAG: hypothetical protein A3J83_01415 [Elusimicrobia bacterium RIFOXYA2_FULL_40_6]
MRKNIAILLIVFFACVTILGLLKFLEKKRSAREIMVGFGAEKVKTIELRNSQGHYIFKKIKGPLDDEKVWKISEPGKNKGYYNADSKSIEGILKAITEMRFTDIATENPEKWKDVDVDGLKSIKFVLTGPDNKVFAIYIGKQWLDLERFYSRISGKPQVWFGGNLNVDSLKKSYDVWRSKTLLKIEEGNIRKIIIIKIAARPSKIITLINTGSNWENASGSAITREDIKPILDKLKDFSASEISLAEKSIKNIQYRVLVELKNGSNAEFLFGRWFQNYLLIGFKDDPTLFVIDEKQLKPFIEYQ